jgi:elongation factor Ts
MVLGRIKKFYEENCLLKQAFIKDDKMTIADLLHGAKINRYVFFVMGEGLEKKSEDFGEEIAKQVAAAQK